MGLRPELTAKDMLGATLRVGTHVAWASDPKFNLARLIAGEVTSIEKSIGHSLAVVHLVDTVGVYVRVFACELVATVGRAR